MFENVRQDNEYHLIVAVDATFDERGRILEFRSPRTFSYIRKGYSSKGFDTKFEDVLTHSEDGDLLVNATVLVEGTYFRYNDYLPNENARSYIGYAISLLKEQGSYFQPAKLTTEVRAFGVKCGVTVGLELEREVVFSDTLGGVFVREANTFIVKRATFEISKFLKGVPGVRNWMNSVVPLPDTSFYSSHLSKRRIL